MSYLIVDEMHHEHPELIKDQYWDEVFPSQLPYTVASVQNKESEPQPSTANIAVNKRAAEVIPVVPSSNKMEDMVGKSSSSTTVIYKFPEKNDENEDNKSLHEVRQSDPFVSVIGGKGVAQITQLLAFMNVNKIILLGCGISRDDYTGLDSLHFLLRSIQSESVSISSMGCVTNENGNAWLLFHIFLL